MKLYKIRSIAGDRGVSVFPPVDTDFEEPTEDLAFFGPDGELVRHLVMKGYATPDAIKVVYGLYHYAYKDLHLMMQPLRTYVTQCVHSMPEVAPPPEPLVWGIVITVAVLVAVALGLYVWAVLEQEAGLTFGTHPWAYLLRYEEALWQGELFGVSPAGIGIYERGGPFGPAVFDDSRNIYGERNHDFLSLRLGGIVLEGRKPIFYYVYRLTGFFVYYCGMLSEMAGGLYKLKSGGDDPYLPRESWSRPGGRWGTADYAGCWLSPFWWL